MRCFVRRPGAAVAVAFAAMTGASIAAPAISSAQCDMSWNRTTLECTPQPAPPAWYTPPPPYAPSFASQDVPPPPATQPPWAPQVPMWSTRYHQWGFYAGGAWVPL